MKKDQKNKHYFPLNFISSGDRNRSKATTTKQPKINSKERGTATANPKQNHKPRWHPHNPRNYHKTENSPK